MSIVHDSNLMLWWLLLQLSYHDENKALKDLRNSEVRAVLRFPRNYTKRMSEKISEGMLQNYDDAVLLEGFVDVWLDNSSMVFHFTYSSQFFHVQSKMTSLNFHLPTFLFSLDRLSEDFVRYDIMRSMMSFLRRAIIQCGKNPDIIGIPIVVICFCKLNWQKIEKKNQTK